MGHLRLGSLPRTRAWSGVISLLGAGASLDSVAAASAAAGHDALTGAKRDPGFVEAFWLLTQIPIAARRDDFAGELRARGMDVPDHPSVMDVTTAITECIDARLHGARRRTDLGEIAAMSAVEAITHEVGRRLPALFDATPRDVQSAFSSFATEKQFGALARSFFAKLAERSLSYFLSRELSVHVGRGERFATIDDHTAFNHALHEHCFEAARIVEDFAGAWVSKKHWQGAIDREDVGRFAHIAFGKLNSELRRREDDRGR